MPENLAKISTPIVFGLPYFSTGLPYFSTAALYQKTKTNLSRTDVRTVGAMDTQKGKSGKFLIYLLFQRPTPSRHPPILHQQ